LPAPLVLAGHGFTQHKNALFPPALVNELTGRGFAVAAIDAPCHGDRQPAGADDRKAVARGYRAHWREFGASRIACELSALLDELVTLPDVVGRPSGYWGLSLATQYGLGFLASESRIACAVLGLSALPEPGPRIEAYARGVSCPVHFMLREEDEVASPRSARALFDLIGSDEKTLATAPGRHQDLEPTLFEGAYAFLLERLRPSHLLSSDSMLF
jgi:hypothetical protein